jgi:hypothetical protein
MISHKHKCIFIHIPKTAGSSVNLSISDGEKFDWKTPNYQYLYGWCPKRKLHLQHATAFQLLDTELITQTQWNEYYKFSFVRNPWDRAYSDYNWIMKDSSIEGSFEDYILKKGPFTEIFNNKDKKEYRGDHLLKQTDFFNLQGDYTLDFMGRFESFNADFKKIKRALKIKQNENFHEKKSTKQTSYRDFYNTEFKKLVEANYNRDIKELNYNFENKKNRSIIQKFFKRNTL